MFEVNLFLKMELIISFGLVVLIWIIQLLHYPSFPYVSPEKFIAFEIFHTQKISFIVMPLMLMELALSTYFVVQSKGQFVTLIVLAFVICLWLVTALVQVPIHQQLSRGYSMALIEELIKTNWIRTVLWSVKFVIIFLYKT